MTIAKKKVEVQTFPINQSLTCKKTARKDDVVNKYHNTLGNNDDASFEINLAYYGGGSFEERFV